MELAVKILLYLILVGVFAFGEDFEKLIEQIKKAPPEERYIYMNELKLRLRELHEERRKEIVKKLYRELSGREPEHKMREELKHEKYEMEERHPEIEHEERMEYKEIFIPEYEENKERERFKHEEKEWNRNRNERRGRWERED